MKLDINAMITNYISGGIVDPRENKDKNHNDYKKMSRRRFFKEIFTLIGGLGMGSLFGYSFLQHPYDVRYEFHSLPIPHIGKSWIGKKIVLLSDFHSSTAITPDFLLSHMERINRIQPDLIFLTGDYVTGPRENADPLVEVLRSLKNSMGEQGRFAVLGNHDYWADRDYVSKRLEEGGFRVLVNENTTLEINGEKLYLMGLDDMWCGTIDLKKMTQGIDDLKNQPTLLISHNPDIFCLVARIGIGVVLSGHTHGGQVCIPLVGHPLKPSVYGFMEGFYHLRDSLLYVNRGIGTISPPIRFLCPPEVTVFTVV